MFRPTAGSAIDHLAFSFERIEPVLARMKAAGVQIVRDIEIDPEHGLTSFFVLGPDKLLVEVVQERPVPEGIWTS